MQIQIECGAVALPRCSATCARLRLSERTPPRRLASRETLIRRAGTLQPLVLSLASSACDMPRAFLITHRRYVHPADQHKGETNKSELINCINFLLQFPF